MTCSFSSLCLFLVLGVGQVHGFVNVPQVRTSLLQSTSTSVTYEPSFVLVDSATRNPFESDHAKEKKRKEEEIAAENNEKKTSLTNDLQFSSASTDAAAAVVTTISGTESSSFLEELLFNTNGVAKSFLNNNASSNNNAAAMWLWWIRRMRMYLQSERARQRVQASLRVSLHNFLRDSGALRGIMDFLVTIGTPALAMEYPEIVPRFLQLSRECTRISYGSHSMQGVDMFLPEEISPRGLLFFVHGGAWGSGQPWMYRLLAQPFLEKGMAVAVVGYRTFPCGDIRDQVNDLEAAAKELTRRYPSLCKDTSDLGVCAAGHSSGAHILMQFLVNRLQRKLAQRDNPSNMADDAEEEMRMDALIGLSAPYEIASHYEFESLRGLEELSPMKAACGNNKERLSEYSPVLQLFNDLSRRSGTDKAFVNEHCPRIAMVHGVHDDTVPYTSTRQAAKLLNLAGINKCDELYLSETGHSETVFHIMLGGKTKDAVFSWLEKDGTGSNK